MTKDEAMMLCRILPEDAYTTIDTYSRQPSEHMISSLKENFPEFNWRVILDRSYDRTRWTLTVDDDDKREHYVPESKDPEYPNTCIHCDKTAKELGVEEREEYDRD